MGIRILFSGKVTGGALSIYKAWVPNDMGGKNWEESGVKK